MVRAVWEDLLEEKELSWRGSARRQKYSGSGGFTFTEAARPLYQSVGGTGLHIRNRDFSNVEEDALIRVCDDAQDLLQRGQVAQVAAHEMVALAPQQQVWMELIFVGLDF